MVGLYLFLSILAVTLFLCFVFKIMFWVSEIWMFGAIQRKLPLWKSVTDELYVITVTSLVCLPFCIIVGIYY